MTDFETDVRKFDEQAEEFPRLVAELKSAMRLATAVRKVEGGNCAPDDAFEEAQRVTFDCLDMVVRGACFMGSARTILPGVISLAPGSTLAGRGVPSETTVTTTERTKTKSRRGRPAPRAAPASRACPARRDKPPTRPGPPAPTEEGDDESEGPSEIGEDEIRVAKRQGSLKAGDGREMEAGFSRLFWSLPRPPRLWPHPVPAERAPARAPCQPAVRRQMAIMPGSYDVVPSRSGARPTPRTVAAPKAKASPGPGQKARK